jgi:hypothetical protein
VNDKSMTTALIDQQNCQLTILGKIELNVMKIKEDAEWTLEKWIVVSAAA